MFQCIWCQKEFEDAAKTRDHLKPRSLGGQGGTDNIRLACAPCNNERGILPSHHGNYKYIKSKIKKWRLRHPEAPDMFRWLSKMIRRYNLRSASIKKVLEKWVAIENERLGVSPSAKIPFVWKISCAVPSTPELSTCSQSVMSG
jgi:hypothetical protein